MRYLSEPINGYLLTCAGVGATFGAFAFPVARIGEFFHPVLYLAGTAMAYAGVLWAMRPE